MTSFLTVNGQADGVVDGWVSAAPVWVSVNDEFVGGGDEPAGGGLGEQRVSRSGRPDRASSRAPWRTAGTAPWRSPARPGRARSKDISRAVTRPAASWSTAGRCPAGQRLYRGRDRYSIMKQAGRELHSAPFLFKQLN